MEEAAGRAAHSARNAVSLAGCATAVEPLSWCADWSRYADRPPFKLGRKRKSPCTEMSQNAESRGSPRNGCSRHHPGGVWQRQILHPTELASNGDLQGYADRSRGATCACYDEWNR